MVEKSLLWVLWIGAGEREVVVFVDQVGGRGQNKFVVGKVRKSSNSAEA